MWAFHCEALPGRDGLAFTVDRGGRPASFADVVCAWQSDAAFRVLFNSVLAAAPFPAFRWETPPVTSATAMRPFEFVLLADARLPNRADASAFAEHLVRAPESGVVEFANLGRDAILIVPTAMGPAAAYPHLAAFTRAAPEEQRQALWRATGAATQRRLSARPVWLSTAGAGVPWLHVRLDDGQNTMPSNPTALGPGNALLGFLALLL